MNQETGTRDILVQSPAIKLTKSIPYFQRKHIKKRRGAIPRRNGIHVRFHHHPHSNLLQFTPSTRHMKKRILRLGRKIIQDILVKDDTSKSRGLLRDYLKSPMNNFPCSGLLTTRSTDMYFGKSYPDDSPGCLEGPAAPGTTYRAAYASSSGDKTIAIDPMYKTYHQLTPELEQLASIVQEVLSLFYRDNPPCDGHVVHFSFDINCISVKGYWDGKFVNWHCDIEYDRSTGLPKNNSQVPSTPVVIMNFGDDKVHLITASCCCVWTAKANNLPPLAANIPSC